MIFEDVDAEMNKERAGQKYRPSNGTEGDMFMYQYCRRCRKYDNCDLVSLSILHDVDDPEYPEEWQYGENGQPVCTELEKKITLTPKGDKDDQFRGRSKRHGYKL